MKTYMLIALLPCIWAADFKIHCPDGNLCPVGKTCCEAPGGSFSCCDLVEEERENKKLVPAFSPSFSRNVSFSYCYGTECSSTFCCEHQGATCCSGDSCCPGAYRCCGAVYTAWCCKSNQRCASTYMYCIAGAASLAPGIAAMILIFITALVSRRF